MQKQNKDTLFVKYMKNVSSITHILAALSILPQKAGQAYQCWPLNQKKKIKKKKELISLQKLP